MKLYVFEGDETDWVAADNEQAAHDCLRDHYGISDDDIAGSYTDISEVDPVTVEFYTDETDAETEKTIMTTAAEMMAGKTSPFVLGSTAWQ